MKNYVQDGKAIEVTAPGTVTAGSVVLIGSLYGVAVDAAASAAPVVIVTEGVFSLPANASVAAGDSVEWDGSECVDLSSGVNIGVAVTASASGYADVKIG